MNNLPLSSLLKKNGMVTNNTLLNKFMIPNLLSINQKNKCQSGGSKLSKKRKEILGEVLPDAYISQYTGSRQRIKHYPKARKKTFITRKYRKKKKGKGSAKGRTIKIRKKKEIVKKEIVKKKSAKLDTKKKSGTKKKKPLRIKAKKKTVKKPRTKDSMFKKIRINLKL